jgi:hypothetical protein
MEILRPLVIDKAVEFEKVVEEFSMRREGTKEL